MPGQDLSDQNGPTPRIGKSHAVYFFCSRASPNPLLAAEVYSLRMVAFPTPMIRPVSNYFGDERGSFSRIFDKEVDNTCAQVNTAFNAVAGTVRGLHYLRGCPSESKLIRILSGSIFDVCVDLRSDSPTFGHVFTFFIDDPRIELVVPKHFAHGYQSLEDNTSLIYKVSTPFRAHHDSGISPFSPDLRIQWPLEVTAISSKDRFLPDFSRELQESKCTCT